MMMGYGGKKALNTSNYYSLLLNGNDLILSHYWGTQSSCCVPVMVHSSLQYLGSVNWWGFLSPTRVDEDNSRIPSKINFVECLCQGCVINQQEDMTYNSVPVFWTVKVLVKTQCVDDPKKYVVKKTKINVPVACLCAVPKYVNWSGVLLQCLLFINHVNLYQPSWFHFLLTYFLWKIRVRAINMNYIGYIHLIGDV